MDFEVIRGYKKKYKGIRDPLHFLGFDCFSYGFNEGFYTKELNAIFPSCLIRFQLVFDRLSMKV